MLKLPLNKLILAQDGIAPTTANGFGMLYLNQLNNTLVVHYFQLEREEQSH